MPTTNEPRVVITGMGIVSPLGIGREPFWESLLEGRSGIGPFYQFGHEPLPTTVSGEVRDFEARKLVSQQIDQKTKRAYLKSLKVMSREIQLGVAAAHLALDDSRVEMSEVNPDRLGVDFGANLMLTHPEELSRPVSACLDDSKKFDFGKWGEHGLVKMFPLWLLKYLPNMPACHIGITFDARGPNNTITLGEASANLAISEAHRIISRGSADIMIAGATGTCVHPMKSAQTALQEELSKQDGAHASRPFDANRDGMVLGEGSAVFLMETLQHAQDRDATIYAEIAGAGSSCSATPDGKPRITRALLNAMKQAVKNADYCPDDIGHVNAHGVSTRQGDQDEAMAIHQFFENRKTPVPVTAPKSYFGNLGSGTGAVELAVSSLELHHQTMIPALNYETPDPDCPIHVTSGAPRALAGPSVMNLNFTRMGQASCLILKQFQS